MFDRVCQIPPERFAAAWNSAASLDEAAARLKELAGGTVPRWAVMARATELRKDGVELKNLRRAGDRTVRGHQ